MRNAHIVILFLVALSFSFVAEAKPPMKWPSKAAVDKLTKECEVIAATATSEEVAEASAVFNHSGLDAISKAETGALVQVVRTIKTGDKKAMNVLEHGTKSKPSIAAFVRPEIAAFFKELAYFMWVGKGEVKDDARDSCFTKSFLVAMYTSNWGNPHIDEECAQKVHALFIHSHSDKNDETDNFVTAMEDSKVIKDCTVRNEQEFAARNKQFCSARQVFQNLAGYDPLSCTDD